VIIVHVHQISDYCATNACRMICASLKALKNESNRRKL